jgi:hypothetical protein
MVAAHIDALQAENGLPLLDKGHLTHRRSATESARGQHENSRLSKQPATVIMRPAP